MGASPFLRPPSEFTTRFCFVDFDGATAIRDLNGPIVDEDAFVERYAPNIAKGIKRLREFVLKYV